MVAKENTGSTPVRAEALLALAVLAAAAGLVKTGRMWVLVVVGVLIVAVLAARWAFRPQRHLPRNRVRHMHIRLKFGLHPGPGHATTWQIRRKWGAAAARKRHTRIDGSRAVSHPDDYSITLGRAHFRQAMRVPVEEHVAVFSPPRKGKSGWLARVILHYPGPVVSTTTRADLFAMTSGIRSQGGRPIHTFNPGRVDHVPSTCHWNPLEGCQDPATAIRRAADFTAANSQGGVEDGNWFAQRASAYLRAFFAAAALENLDMRAVAGWALDSVDVSDAQEILLDHGRQKWARGLTQIIRGEARKTVETIQQCMSQALQFMDDPVLAAAALPGGPGEQLDIGQFLRDRGTLYLIAAAEHDESPLAGLFAALTSEIHHVAGLIGSRMPSGRLDPPALFALDEVTQICPVPLPVWLADSGGKGIQIIPVAHGEAQLRSRWGADGARVVLDTCDTHVILSGVKDPQTLETASKLCGNAAYREGGRDHDSRHEVMSPDMIRQLPDWRALVIRGGLYPVIARLPMCWEDQEYKRAKAAGTARAQIAPRAARVVVQPAEEQSALPSRPAIPLTDLSVVAPAEAEVVRDDDIGGGPQFPWSGGAR